MKLLHVYFVQASSRKMKFHDHRNTLYNEDCGIVGLLCIFLFNVYQH